MSTDRLKPVHLDVIRRFDEARNYFEDKGGNPCGAVWEAEKFCYVGIDDKAKAKEFTAAEFANINFGTFMVGVKSNSDYIDSLESENAELRTKVAELEADINNNKGGVFAYDANGEAWVRLGFKIVKDSEVNHENTL